MSKVSVLIVGAGPTGLMMAYELARQGIAFRIVDKKAEATQYSNAALLQTRTLEIFKQVDLIDDFLRLGQPCKGIRFNDGNHEYASLSFDKLESIYPYVLTLPQSSTENILNAKLEELHHKVERARELTAITIHDNHVESVIQHQDGIQEIIYSDWLMGCDGAHSKVREKCHFEFSGEDIEEQFVVADGIMDSFLRPDEVNIFTTKGAILGVFPIESNRYRLGANMQLGYPRKIYTENEIRELVAERSSGLFTAREINWISPFWIHSKMTNKMRAGRVFLAGDAAHIHSPIGGQGMNTGLQDVHNLAWKLALVIQGRAEEKLLDSYQQERLPVIKEIVETTERFTRLLLMNNALLNFLKKYMIKFAFSFPFVKRYVVKRMTQIAIQYQHSCALYGGSDHSTSPAIGERAPDVKLNSHYFYSYLTGSQHHLICFTGDREIFKVADACHQIAIDLLGPYKDVLSLHLVTPHLLDEPIDQIFDETNALHKMYHITKPTLLLIRPDGYISFKSHDINSIILKTFLQSYLIT